jgi:hypothetical protein
VNEPESGGLFVGDLTLHLIRRAGDRILPVLPDLLRAFVTRLTTALTMTFTQSLVLPFAYLIHTQLDTVLSLVESMEISGRSGLELLISAWTSCHPSIQGYWNTRISYVSFLSLSLLSALKRPINTDVDRLGQLR